MPDAVRTVRPRRLAWTCTGRVRPSAGYRGAVTAWHGDELDFAAYLERIGSMASESRQSRPWRLTHPLGSRRRILS